MSLPLAQPGAVLRAWQKDELYRGRLAGLAGPAGPLLYAACTTLRDLQTPGEEYAGIVQVDGSYARLPSRPARLLAALLSAAGRAAAERALRRLARALAARADLTPGARRALSALLRALAAALPQLETAHRALCYARGGPLRLGQALLGIDYVQARPAAAHRARLRLLGLATLAHALLSCGQTFYRVKEEMEHDEELSDELESARGCVACLEELGQPCALPCGHIFCMQCSYGALESCALCRMPFTRNTVVPLQNYDPGS